MNRLVALAASLLLLTPAGCGSGGGLSFKLGAQTLAGMAVSPATSYRGVLRYFAHAGQHASSSFPRGSCVLRFAQIGLATSFYPLMDKASPRTCRFGFDAVAKGLRWHTANGLRTGMTLAELRRLYPRARRFLKLPRERQPYRTYPPGSTMWVLANPGPTGSAVARTLLVAYLSHGHVAALGITVVGH